MIDITSIVLDWTIYQVEGGIVLSVQFAVPVGQKTQVVRIFEIPERLLILPPLEPANGHMNIKIMHKGPKYFRNSFASRVTSKKCKRFVITLFQNLITFRVGQKSVGLIYPN